MEGIPEVPVSRVQPAEDANIWSQSIPGDSSTPPQIESFSRWKKQEIDELSTRCYILEQLVTCNSFRTRIIGNKSIEPRFEDERCACIRLQHSLRSPRRGSRRGHGSLLSLLQVTIFDEKHKYVHFHNNLTLIGTAQTKTTVATLTIYTNNNAGDGQQRRLS